MKALLILLLCPTYLAAAWPQNPSLSDLEKAIQKQGTKSVVRELMVQADSEKGPNPWVWIGDNIGAGSPEWLDFAVRIAPFLDGIYSEGLDEDMAAALRKNPAAILKLLDGKGRFGFNIDQTCSESTFGEITDQQSAQQLEEARTAVSKVSDPRLKSVRNACLKKLDEDLRRVRRTPEHSP